MLTKRTKSQFRINFVIAETRTSCKGSKRKKKPALGNCWKIKVRLKQNQPNKPTKTSGIDAGEGRAAHGSSCKPETQYSQCCEKLKLSTPERHLRDWVSTRASVSACRYEITRLLTLFKKYLIGRRNNRGNATK